MVEGHDARRAGELLDELDGLGVVLLLDHLVVLERGVRDGAAEVLEAGRVERDGVLLAAEVLNLDLVRLADAVVGEDSAIDYWGLSYGTLVGAWFINSAYLLTSPLGTRQPAGLGLKRCCAQRSPIASAALSSTASSMLPVSRLPSRTRSAFLAV